MSIKAAQLQMNVISERLARDYPVEDTIAAVRASPLPDRAKEMLADAFRTGGAAYTRLRPTAAGSAPELRKGNEDAIEE